MSGWDLTFAPSTLPRGGGGLSDDHGFSVVEDPSRLRHVDGFGFFVDRSICWVFCSKFILKMDLYLRSTWLSVFILWSPSLSTTK